MILFSTQKLILKSFSC